MSGLPHTTNIDSDSASDDQSEACQNAVDYLLFKFPPETGVIDDNATSPKFDDPIQIKNEVDDVAALPEVDSPIQLKEETEDGTASPSERDENEAKGEMFDPHLGTNYGYTELNGYRWYFLEKEAVCLKPDDINSIKTMTNTASFDSKFVSILLNAVFGEEILKKSSAGGHKSNYNDVSHKALDGKKLKFIKDLFDERVLDDEERKKKFTKLVNKKCNNLRRN